VLAKALDRNLLITTWNIRAFGDLIEKWESDEEDTPKRNLHSLLSIAEIVSRLDVVAVQEARENLKLLRHLLKVFGPNWGLSLTDVTEGSPGNGERKTFLFDTRRVVPPGLVPSNVGRPTRRAYHGPEARAYGGRLRSREHTDPVAQYQPHLAQCPYLVQRIPGRYGQVRVLARLQGTQHVAQTEQFRRIRGTELERLSGRRAGFDHQSQLFTQRAVRMSRGAAVGAGRNGHAGL
jgi:hypothetical protein